MKLFYLSTSTIPSKSANSVHVMRMCQALARKGSEVTLFAARGNAGMEDGVHQLYAVEKNFQLDYASWPQARTLGGFIYGWRVRHAILSNKRPDFLYARHLGSLFMLRNSGVPMAFEAHQPPQRSWQRWMLTLLLRHPHFQFLVVISEALKQKFLAIFPFFPSDKIVVCHDGADPMPWAAPSPKSDRNTPLKAGYIGSLYKGRGIEIIIYLARQFPQIQFEILGGETMEIKRWKQSGAPDNLCFLGFLPQREVMKRYPEYDILLAPYQEKVNVDGGGDTSQYMSPLKIFEYMAAGKAIVTSNHAVLKEVLRDGHNAILCDPGNWKSWEQAFQQLIHDEDFRFSLGENARNDLLAHYTWDIRAERILEQIHSRVSVG